ncbi:MAG: hydantoinase B/oxoprolinase family protein [Aestuariivita sp.]|nr:hydantoinase B/oxoprolinase family protein [Aestuariivita sp.]MCY4345631.1 hydantoinase B/oxoprolinase family protein [Aestuariivita sp.]
MWQFWVDRGGTFTDIIAKTPNGQFRIHKLLSENSEFYSDAAVQGIRELLGIEPNAPIPKSAIKSVKMGTTVATNALLERKGAPTILLITKGLGDLLRIGYQNRPRLFDLKIERPEVLYDEVVEITERIDAEGSVLTELDMAKAKADLTKAFDRGFRSVAVALMHSYRFPEHEIRLGELAERLGFSQVSLSHRVSPLIKLVSRGDTAVADAYLSPILRNYLQQVAGALGEAEGETPPLMFMQSNGGLVAAENFSGRDAIISGPAGGVVGMVRTATDCGFDSVIGFDMGGTSTDVCHFAGEFERDYETEIAGVRMRVPMMSIHTVAAGGGSILLYEDGRMQVGPDSAGANPGPAAYRRGGPLTVTDCNVLLGRLQAEQFPAVFGSDGNQRLDVDIVKSKFAKLARAIGGDRAVEDVAEGFLRIAVENMANAIKKISIQRGHDVTKYTMNCFGGAGGQHACRVADALGIRSIYIHPFAGVLSALGIGLADIRVIKEHQLGTQLLDLSEARTIVENLSNQARREVARQGVCERLISVIQTAHMRVEGAQQTLPVPFGEAATMRTAFNRAHKYQFGFTPQQASVVIELLTAEAIGKTGETVELQESPDAVRPAKQATMWLGDRWGRVPLIDRRELTPLEALDGPAIVIERTATTIVERGWQAKSIAGGHLILQRVCQLQPELSLGSQPDPVLLEVFNNLFMSIADQMGATLANTAYSVNIKERLDFSCALFDAKGDLVANAPHVPVHLGSMSETVRQILSQNRGNIKPGDVFAINDPYNGGTHLPDVTVITPIFDEAGQDIICTVASRGHHADIGGKTPGSAPPDSRTIFEEGVVLNNVLLVENAQIRNQHMRALLGSGDYPCRNIAQNMADLSAQVAANETGVHQIRAIIRQYGLETIQAYMSHVQDNAEASVRSVIDVLKDCSFVYPLDGGSQIKVAISIDRESRCATIDFLGTSAQSTTNYNAPLAICRAAVLYVFRTLVGKDIPMNEGCLRPLVLKVPEGCMINPRPPAAVVAGNTEISQAISDTLFGALGVVAGSQGTMNNFVYGNGSIQNYETICGGTGAGDGFDGASAVHSHMTNTRMTDPEVLETRFPVLLEEFSIRRGSGGRGRFDGGSGAVRRLRFLEPMMVTVLSSHREVPPFGVRGGAPGAVGMNYLERRDGSREQLAGNDVVLVDSGDVFVMKTPGGGGFGAIEE